jgi:hypothetical protein
VSPVHIEELNPETRALAQYDAARAALEQAHTVDEVKHIRDKAEALRIYAKQAADVDMQNWAAEIRIRAERRAGELLKDIPKQHGARGVGKKVESPSATPLVELGVTKTQSSNWQRLADVPASEFENKLRGIMGLGKELTTAAMMKAVTPANTKPQVDGMDDLLKRLSPLLPIGADGQPRLAELIEQAKAADADADPEKMRTAISMLHEIADYFAASAKALEDRIQFARVV